jgi:hypothetical protein
MNLAGFADRLRDCGPTVYGGHCAGTSIFVHNEHLLN